MNLEVRYDAPTRTFRIPVPGKVLIPAINEWPGWKRHLSGTYMAPAWPSAILAMSKTAHTLRWDEAAAKARDEIVWRMGLARGCLIPNAKHPDEIAKTDPTERRPRPHQRQAVAAMRYMGWRVLLADDMGLGKTSAALWAAHDAGVKRILVICPVSVKFNWRDEILETLGESWVSFVVDGSSKSRADVFAQAGRFVSGGSVALIINYDLLRHLSEAQLAQLQTFAADGMLLLDESHYLKDRNTERTKIATTIAARAPCVIAMTGTPIRNLADDLFSQVEIVRPGTWTSYRDFAKRHIVTQAVKFGKREIQKIVGVRNLDALNAVMNTLQIKRSKSEVLDLPPKIYTYPELQLEGDLRKIYNAMKDFAKIELGKLVQPQRKPSDVMGDLGISAFQHGSQRITGDQVDAAMGAMPEVNIFDPRARSAVEQAMRCEQIANGFIGGIPEPVMRQLGEKIFGLAEKIEGRPHELMFPTHPKVVWLLETIGSIIKQGGAPLIGSRFNAPLLWLRKRLMADGLKVGLIYGDMSAEVRHETIIAFQNHHIDVLLSQVKIGEGWNAHRSQDVIHWSRDWSPAINSQFEDRAHRMGQRGTVNVQVPIVRKTIEAMIDRRLRTKGADAEQALRTVTIAELMEAL